MDPVTWKRLLKRVTPPFLMDLYAKGVRPASSGFVWEGIYDNFAAVPTTGAGFSGDEWLSSMQAALAHQATRPGATATFPLGVAGESATLALLGSVVCHERRRLTVLDFGGGAGGTFLPFVHGMAGCDAVDVHVVDMPAVCELGAKFWAGEGRIHFHAELPSKPSRVDIVHISSALQYVEDYPGLLRRLCEYEPRFFLFVRLSAGDIPTYATAQRNVRGSTLPYWFLNVNELIALMAGAGYELRFKELLAREYDQSNFPPTHRLGRTCNLMFARAATT